MKPSVLIVDDEAGVRSALSGVLRDEGYAVEAVESGRSGNTAGIGRGSTNGSVGGLHPSAHSPGAQASSALKPRFVTR